MVSNLAFDARLESGRRWVAVAPPGGTAVLTLIAPEPGSPEYKLIGRVIGDIAAILRGKESPPL
ncbi:MAG: hypothetical protein ACRD8O_18200 [Bryobacteraceae bacterium]